MNELSGKFIVIDGTDGSGKTTQLCLLKARLEEEGYDVAIADFPQYNTKSAGLVEEYLSGKYGQAEEVNSYQASIFYAVDRYDASFKIRQWLAEGKIVLANRYTSANMGHQGGKIANPLERKVFFNWLYDLEYKIFEIPRPDLSIILHVESAVAQELAKTRAREDWIGKKADIHEDNLDHLKKAELIYLEIANSFPDFKLISCTKNNAILSREEISLLIWPAVKKIIAGDIFQSRDFQAVGNIIGSNRQIVDNREIIFDNRKASEPAIKNDVNDVPVIKNNLPAKLIIEKVSPQAKLPQKAHPGDAGYDLYANNYYSIPPYGQDLVGSGVKMVIPEGYVGLIWDKSGLAFQGIKMMGGVIDSNYRGEIKMVVKNLSEDDFNIIPGQKIAQILIQPVLDLEISEEPIIDETERQANGFGSSGQF
ncbi:MAG: dUTP diphosphatase [Candidatus Falkowbacteria bacterium]|nr:dUTP diphosphatase [Candidatus Falkowbacteria bacterium]